jgi:transcriptional regulator with XRE-family HTH domain
MPKSAQIEDFAAKLAVICKRLNWSRAKLAQQVAIDKSLAGRWLSGASRPTGNNLMRLTDTIVRALPDFGAATWDLPTAMLARQLGGALPPDEGPSSASRGTPAAEPSLLPSLRTFARFIEDIDYLAPVYEGFYFMWFTASTGSGTICRRRARIVRRGSALLITASGHNFEYDGAFAVSGDRLYGIAENPRFAGPVYCILNGSSGRHATLMTGLTLFQSTIPGQFGVVCLPTALEYQAPLSGDAAADERTWAELATRHRDFELGENEAEVPEAVRRALHVVVGAPRADGTIEHVLLMRAVP